MDPLDSSGQYRKLASYFVKYAVKTRKTDEKLMKSVLRDQQEPGKAAGGKDRGAPETLAEGRYLRRKGTTWIRTQKSIISTSLVLKQ